MTSDDEHQVGTVAAARTIDHRSRDVSNHPRSHDTSQQTGSQHSQHLPLADPFGQQERIRDLTKHSMELGPPVLDVVLTALMPIGSEVIYWTHPSPFPVGAYDRNKRRRSGGRRVQVVLGEFPYLRTCELHQIAPAAGVSIDPARDLIVERISGLPSTYTLTYEDNLPAPHVTDARADRQRGGRLEDQLADWSARTVAMPQFLRAEDALAAAPMVNAVLRWQVDARARLQTWGADALNMAAILVNSGVKVSEDELRYAALALLTDTARPPGRPTNHSSGH